MHVDRALRPLADFEKLLGELYAWLSESFAADPEAAGAFALLASEEAAHANLVEYQRRLVRQNPKAFGEVEMDLGDLLATRAQVERLRAGEVPSLAEALQFAFTIETSAAEFHFRNVLRQANPEIGQLLDNLGKGDKRHLGRIMELASRHGIMLTG